MDKFTARSTSLYSQKILEPIIIESGERTRRVFIAETNDKKLKSGETVSGTIVHQRKNAKAQWENVEAINLSMLKGGEGVKIQMRSGQLKKFYDGLSKLYTVSNKGVKFGHQEYVVGSEEEMLHVPSERKNYIQRLLDENYGEEIWKELIDKNPDLATKLARARLQSARESIVSQFESSINDASLNEQFWQEFFTQNAWIFGYGLNYHFLSIEEDQPHYGATDYSGKGAQKGDYLMSTNSANSKFTVLVEIKKPSSRLLAQKSRSGNPIRYRNGAWLLGSEVLGGVSQLQVNCKTWERYSDQIENRNLIEKGVLTARPKGILLIGRTSELEDEMEKSITFELFRQGLSGLEILTYDELLERAKFIVKNESDEPSSNNIISKSHEDPDLPF